MKNKFLALLIPAILGALTTIPFVALEWSNGDQFKLGFPYPVFIPMWLFASAFFSLLIPLAQDIKARRDLLTDKLNLSLRLLALVFLVWLWVGFVSDQMPCFLGVPNCD